MEIHKLKKLGSKFNFHRNWIACRAASNAASVAWPVPSKGRVEKQLVPSSLLPLAQRVLQSLGILPHQSLPAAKTNTRTKDNSEFSLVAADLTHRCTQSSAAPETQKSVSTPQSKQDWWERRMKNTWGRSCTSIRLEGTQLIPQSSPMPPFCPQNGRQTYTEPGRCSSGLAQQKQMQSSYSETGLGISCCKITASKFFKTSSSFISNTNWTDLLIQTVILNCAHSSC